MSLGETQRYKGEENIVERAKGKVFSLKFSLKQTALPYVSGDCWYTTLWKAYILTRQSVEGKMMSQGLFYRVGNQSVGKSSNYRDLSQKRQLNLALSNMTSGLWDHSESLQWNASLSSSAGNLTKLSVQDAKHAALPNELVRQLHSVQTTYSPSLNVCCMGDLMAC